MLPRSSFAATTILEWDFTPIWPKNEQLGFDLNGSRIARVGNRKTVDCGEYHVAAVTQLV
jgi:hypothetical protein